MFIIAQVGFCLLAVLLCVVGQLLLSFRGCG